MGTSLAQEYGINITQVDDYTIHLTGRADQQDYVVILGEVMYENRAEEPGAITRQVQFTIMTEDGFVSAATTTVQIVPTNDRAVINFADGVRSLLYDERIRLPINLFSVNDTISDSDGDSLERLSIVLSPGIDTNDMLSASAGATGLEVTIETLDDGQVTLNISGNANFNVYETVMASVTFTNTFPGISQESRRIQVVTFDGETPSAIHPISISIIGFNDPPVCFFNQVVRRNTTLMV